MKLIDSSAWWNFSSAGAIPWSRAPWLNLLQADKAAYTCPIRFELLSGVKLDEEGDLDQAFALSRHVLFEPGDWREAALLERQLRASGLAVPRNDLFVATVAIRTGLPVVCRDAHFDTARKCVRERLRVEKV